MELNFDFIEKYSRKLPFLLAGILFFLFGSVFAQETNPKKTAKKVNKYMQLAEEALAENNFPMAEANYRQAVALDTSNAKPLYNMGTLYYAKDKAPEAASRLSKAGKTSENKTIKHKAFHNQGNAFMKQKNYQAAVEAYKNALRNDPTDDETRYNLALAKKMLEKEQKQQEKEGPKDDKKKDDQKKGDEEKKEDQKGGGDKDKKEDKGDDQKKENGEPEEKDPKKQNDQQQEQQNKQQKPKQGQQQPTPGELSQQQIKNLLEAMQNQEREIQEKLNARKAKGSKVQTEKDW